MKTYTDRALLIAGIVGVTALFAPTARAAEPNSTHVAGACVIDKTSVARASVSDAELRFDAGQSGDIVARCNVINPKDDGLVNPIWKKMEVVYRDPDGGGIAYQVLVTLKSVSNGGVVPVVPVAQFNSNIFGVALAPVMNSAPIVTPFNFAANAYWIEIRIKRPPLANAQSSVVLVRLRG